MQPVPATRRSEHRDVLHGIEVPDPYRWLEDADSPETQAWVAAQNEVTFAYLSRLPLRQELERRLSEVWNHERYSPPQKRGGHYFFSYNSGLLNQSVLCVTKNLSGERRLLLDPNLLSEDGTVALGATEVSPDGRLVAYAISRSGSDWQEWRVRDVESGSDLSDVVRWSKFASVAWAPGNVGFYYLRYEQPNEKSMYEETNRTESIHYHRLGTAQDDDVLIFERPEEKDLIFIPELSDDGRYLVISAFPGATGKAEIYVKDLAHDDGIVERLVAGFDAIYSYVGNVGKTFYFLTSLEAPRRRVVAVDLDDAARSSWSTVIPEDAAVLECAQIAGGRLLCGYLQDARSDVRVFELDGSGCRRVELGQMGTVSFGRGSARDGEVFLVHDSFVAPPTIFRLDMGTLALDPVWRPKVNFVSSDFETRQAFVPGKDGTRVPVFLTHRKGLLPNGDVPVYLYGYGGFEVSLTPTFTPSLVPWLEAGGIYAVAVLRGGGEYGEEWHEAGTRQRKQNVFDDFISVAEWLVGEGWTRPERLAIAGGSNGGLLVGACLTQRPDLFGVALPSMGVLDMLRFHKFTIGWGWIPDYGDPDSPEDFKALYAYSPVHNVKEGTSYPATLICTADHDDRVVPAHSFKFAAALQAGHAGPAPVLIRIDTKAGHGAGTPVSKVIQSAADRFAFAFHNMGVTEL